MVVVVEAAAAAVAAAAVVEERSRFCRFPGLLGVCRSDVAFVSDVKIVVLWRIALTCSYFHSCKRRPFFRKLKKI